MVLTPRLLVRFSWDDSCPSAQGCFFQPSVVPSLTSVLIHNCPPLNLIAQGGLRPPRPAGEALPCSRLTHSIMVTTNGYEGIRAAKGGVASAL